MPNVIKEKLKSKESAPEIAPSLEAGLESIKNLANQALEKIGAEVEFLSQEVAGVKPEDAPEISRSAKEAALLQKAQLEMLTGSSLADSPEDVEDVKEKKAESRFDAGAYIKRCQKIYEKNHQHN